MAGEDRFSLGSIVALAYYPIPHSGAQNSFEKDAGFIVKVRRDVDGFVEAMSVRPVLDWEHRNYDGGALPGTIQLKSTSPLVGRILDIEDALNVFFDPMNNRIVHVTDVDDEAVVMSIANGELREVVSNQEPVINPGVLTNMEFVVHEANALRWLLTNRGRE